MSRTPRIRTSGASSVTNRREKVITDFLDTCIALAVSATSIWWLVARCRRTRRRDARIAERWTRAHRLAQSSHAELVHVSGVYQHARRRAARRARRNPAPTA